MQGVAQETEGLLPEDVWTGGEHSLRPADRGLEEDSAVGRSWRPPTTGQVDRWLCEVDERWWMSVN